MKCEGKCPNCGSEDIDWGTYWIIGTPMQNATCNECGCSFAESYEYSETIVSAQGVTNDSKTL